MYLIFFPGVFLHFWNFLSIFFDHLNCISIRSFVPDCGKFLSGPQVPSCTLQKPSSCSYPVAIIIVNGNPGFFITVLRIFQYFFPVVFQIICMLAIFSSNLILGKFLHRIWWEFGNNKKLRCRRGSKVENRLSAHFLNCTEQPCISFQHRYFKKSETTNTWYYKKKILVQQALPLSSLGFLSYMASLSWNFPVYTLLLHHSSTAQYNIVRVQHCSSHLSVLQPDELYSEPLVGASSRPEPK